MDNVPFRISERHEKIILPHDPKITGIIPHAEVINRNGKDFLAVPHRSAETRVLRNIGIPIPSPILYQYDWRGSIPFDSQRDTARLMVENRRAYVLNDMGTGKTRAGLFAIDYLIATNDSSKALVIAPLSTLSTVWEREAFAHFPDRKVVVLHAWSKKKRLEALKQDADIYVINHDGIKVLEKELIARDDIDTILIDEVAAFKNHTTRRWKSMNKICNGRRYVWGMTGSPRPKAPTDAFGQAKLITPERIPRFFREFQEQTMIQVSRFKWVEKKNANDIVFDALQPSVRYKRSDCMDLPPTTYTYRQVDMTKEQKKAYQDMLTDFVVKFQAGAIKAANAGVQMQKLLQIATGFIYSNDRVPTTLPHAPRVSLLKEIIEEASNKVIIFVPFRENIEILLKEFAKELLTDELAFIHGGVNKKQRDKIFTAFQDSLFPKIILAHPGTMSHGLTLTAADTIVWYGPPMSLETYEQANARITRPGQTSHTHIVHIQSCGMEHKVYNVLTKRGDAQKAILEMFANNLKQLSLL